MQIITRNNSKSIIFILTLLFTFNSSNIYSQCPPGDVELFTQDDVNAFVAAYPNCTTIDGYLYITGSDVVDLSGLSNISTINGYSGFALYVENTGINNFNYFSNLINCPDIYLAYNSNLTNVNTFNLVSGPTNIKIEGNPLLQSINTLSNTTIENLDIIYNPVLTNLQGFGNSISGNISIIGNSQLSICNMGAICDFITTNGNNNIFINNNASGCNTFDDLWGSCTNLPYGVNLISPQNGSTNVSVSSALSWNTNPFATGYLLRVGTTLGGGNILDDLDVGNTTSHNLATNLPYLTTIFVRITPYNVNGAGQLLNNESFITIGPPTCLPEGITFNTQAQIDAFPTNYPGCTQILGDVCIGDCTSPFTNTNISNLNGLSGITQLGGQLHINSNPNLSNISPLYNIVSVNGTMNLNFNGSIINGFNNLTHVGGTLAFTGNHNTISGFNNLSTSNANIQITKSYSPLSSINGFNSLTSLSYIFLSYQTSLSNISGFNNLITIDWGANPALGGLVIRSCALSNLNFLSNIENLGKILLESNPNLISISGLANLDTIKGNINLVGNSNLSICEINALCNRINPITGNITINSNGSNCNTIAQVQQSCALLLPVTIHSFNIENTSTSNLLHWQTSSEINNHYFEIEYSKNGTDFTNIGRKEAAGNSNTLLDYHFVHKGVDAGMHYYRLKQVDYDGKYSYSDIKSVFVKGEDNEVSIFPNPTSEFISILGMTNGRYEIKDFSGKLVRSGDFISSVLSLEGLSAGIYFVSLTNNDFNGVFKVHKL